MTATPSFGVVTWSSVTAHVDPPAWVDGVVSFLRVRCTRLSTIARRWASKPKVKADDADHQPVDPQAAGGTEGAQESAGAAAIAAEARRLHARLYDDAE